MHPTLTFIAAQQHVEDLRRAAECERLARAATDNSQSSRLTIARRCATARRYRPQLLRLLSISSQPRH
jgi:hypothetical protein